MKWLKGIARAVQRHVRVAFGYDDDEVVWVDHRLGSWIAYRVERDGHFELVGYGRLDEDGRPPRRWR